MSSLWECFVREDHHEAVIEVVAIHPDVLRRPFPDSKGFGFVLLCESVDPANFPADRGRSVSQSELRNAPLSVALKGHDHPKDDVEVDVEALVEFYKSHAETYIAGLRVTRTWNTPMAEDDWARHLDALNAKLAGKRKAGPPDVRWDWRFEDFPRASYAIKPTSGDWIRHLRRGAWWTSAAFEP